MTTTTEKLPGGAWSLPAGVPTPGLPSGWVTLRELLHPSCTLMVRTLSLGAYRRVLMGRLAGSRLLKATKHPQTLATSSVALLTPAKQSHHVCS